MKKCQFFGTDGIRGIIGENLDAELITRIANATAAYLEQRPRIADIRNSHNVASAKITMSEANKDPSKAKILIGVDTRASCDFIVHILAGMLASYGNDIVKVGVVPTAALSFLTNKLNADLGIMVSASHCTAKYNGVKVFTPDGEKLNDVENQVFDKLIVQRAKPQTASKTVGIITENYKAIKLWQNFLVKKFKSLTGSKIKVAIDCAYGSGGGCAREVLHALGFNVTLFNDKYDGFNINDGCGATKPSYLNQAMKDRGFDIGFAFDGDADRCIFFDENGKHIHGDVVIFLLAKYFQNRGELAKNQVVGTILTNLGVEKSLNNLGIKLVRTDVGDASVYYALKENNLTVGGETCGHVIYPKLWCAGDGLVFALLVLAMLACNDKKLSECACAAQIYPQANINTESSPEQKKQLFADANFKEYIKSCQKKYTDFRIIVRPSGTENIVRVTVEGANAESCNKIAAEIITEIKQVLKID